MVATAIVTGAGTGIGRSASLALLARGLRVVLVGRRPERLEETQSLAFQAGALSENIWIYPADITDVDAVDQLFGNVKELWPRLDFLFNNAGVNHSAQPVDSIEPNDWLRVIETNVNGAFYCARAAFRWMKTQHPVGGRILNNGSISAYVPRPQSTAYTTSKHALAGMTKSIALDGREFRILCGQIDIGNASTDMTVSMLSGALQPDGSSLPEPTFDVRHVGELVAQLAELPLDVAIPNLTVIASQMPYGGRG